MLSFFNCVCLCPRLPGDSRTKVGFITFDSTIHFYNLQEGLSQPQMLIVSDIEGEMQLTAKVKRSILQQLDTSCVPAYSRNVDVKNMLGIKRSEPLIC